MHKVTFIPLLYKTCEGTTTKMQSQAYVSTKADRCLCPQEKFLFTKFRLWTVVELNLWLSVLNTLQINLHLR